MVVVNRMNQRRNLELVLPNPWKGYTNDQVHHNQIIIKITGNCQRWINISMQFQREQENYSQKLTECLSKIDYWL